ncbi:MAG TPA: signal peptidase I [Clostridiales bacterium]|nr:signal peptidase I [Clostridiales bacterium]
MRKENNRIINIVLGIAVVITVLFLLCFKITIVSGQSMMPTLNDGSIVLVSKISPEYFKNEIIVFDNMNDTMIKRIVAVEGDIIEIKNNSLYRNGIKLNIACDNRTSVNIKLKQNEYFVIGDNYGCSYDSRDYGCITKEMILGKVI